ncbi:MAG: radical SAM protein [Acidobacteria bacterium]|nr:radical SAM protein [Acidobacteriota bacterium]
MEFFVLNKPAAENPPLVGIARLAAQSPHLATKKSVEYFSLASRSVLNRCTSKRVPFTWTINPYRGCEFGCKYCYARYTHEWMGMEDPADFEEKIYSKERAGEILRRELAKRPSGAIAIGTATDPYQPAERLFQTTRSILQTISEFRGLRVSITTKSDLVTRDRDLLKDINQRNHLQVNITVTTMNAELARCLEVRAPRPDLRIGAAAELARAGIPVGVFAMPVVPAITDSPKSLDAVARAASQAGACHFAVNVLFLMPSAQKAFFPFLEQRFPNLVERYQKLYARGAYAEAPYRARMEELARQLRLKYGLTGQHREYRAEAFAPSPQLQLFGADSHPLRQNLSFQAHRIPPWRVRNG